MYTGLQIALRALKLEPGFPTSDQKQPITSLSSIAAELLQALFTAPFVAHFLEPDPVLVPAPDASSSVGLPSSGFAPLASSGLCLFPSPAFSLAF